MAATYERGLGFTVNHAVDDGHLLSHDVVLLVHRTDSQIHSLMYRYFLAEGDMSVADALAGNNCTDIVHEILGTMYSFKSTLPGDLFYEMSCFIHNGGGDTTDGYTGSDSPPDSYPPDKWSRN